MVLNKTGTSFEISSTMAVLSAGVIGLVNLILTCRPFTKLRVAVCAVMCAGFALAVAFLPHVFFLHVTEMTVREWVVAGGVTAAGLLVLVGGTLVLKPIERKLKKR